MIKKDVWHAAHLFVIIVIICLEGWKESGEMVIFQIAAFLVLILGIGWKFKISMVEAVPVGSALLILTLYILSFFHALSFSDYLAVLGLAAALFSIWKTSAGKRKEIFAYAQSEFLGPAFLTALLMTVVVTICVSGKVVSWWDDYNFWATDVKSIYYLDGFAGKYTNAAAEFGDYPPGAQMMKWWFLHFSGKFREGLMFAGYYFLNLSFLFPFLKVMKKWNKYSLPVMAAGAAALWIFPSVAEAFWMDGCCADLTMAVVYGAFLVSVTDGWAKGRLFYYGRQALFLMILVLCKNTGFMWAAFGLLFDYGYHYLLYRKEVQRQKGAENGQRQEEVQGRKKNRLGLFMVTLLPALTEVSWLLFCVSNRRVAKLTGTAIQMATGGMGIPAYQEKMVKAFVEAFIRWPLHRGETFAWDLSPLGLYLLLPVFMFLLYKFRVLEKRQALYTGIFLAVTGMVFYGVNLICHLTIFAVETQYLEPFGMVSSIERYGAPFAIGGLYLTAFYVTRGGESLKGALLCFLFVLVTADHVGAYRAIAGYRETVQETLNEREEIVDEEAKQFLARTEAGQKGNAMRILYLRDISDVSWVRNTYINFEAAPVSVMYGNVDTASMDSGDIAKAVEDAHAGFLYVDKLPKGGEEILASLTKEDTFTFGCLYQVIEEEGGICLYKKG